MEFNQWVNININQHSYLSFLTPTQNHVVMILKATV